MGEVHTEQVEPRGYCAHCESTITRDASRQGVWVHLGTGMRRCAGVHIDTEAIPMTSEQETALLGAGES